MEDGMIIAIGGAYQCTKSNERALNILIIRAPNLPPAVIAAPIKGADLFINLPSPPPFPLRVHRSTLIALFENYFCKRSKSSPSIVSLYYTPAMKGQGENEGKARSRLDYHRSSES